MTIKSESDRDGSINYNSARRVRTTQWFDISPSLVHNDFGRHLRIKMVVKIKNKNSLGTQQVAESRRNFN